MSNKEKRPHVKDGTERGQKEPRPAGLGPSESVGLAHFQAQSASVFFSAKYSSTLTSVLPKPPEASSSLGAAVSWRTARDPSLAGDFITMIDYASPRFMGGKVLVCSWGCKEILSCNCRILYEIDLS